MQSKKVICMKDISGFDVCVDIEEIRKVFSEIVEKLYIPISQEIPKEACLCRKKDGTHWIINYPNTHNLGMYKDALDYAGYVEWLPLPKIP